MNEETTYTYMDSPVGRMMLVGNSRGLLEISFMAGRAPKAPDPRWLLDDSQFGDAITQLRKLLQWQPARVRLAASAGGHAVPDAGLEGVARDPIWRDYLLRRACAQIGKPRAVRAVGAANGKNPISIVIPCHRVIGSDGSLTGYGGGMENKRFLLALEGSGTMALASQSANDVKRVSANNANNR